MSLRPRKKEEPPPVGSIYSDAITFKPGVLADPGPAASLRPADTDMRISDAGYFVVKLEKKKIKDFGDTYVKEAFADQRAVRVTVSLVLSRGDRIAFAKAAGARLGTKLPAGMFEDAVPYNGALRNSMHTNAFHVSRQTLECASQATTAPARSCRSTR